jgi:hypothetical protein
MNNSHKLLIVAMFLIVTGGLFAQNAQELRFGAVVSGNLNSGDEIWYSLKPTETSLIVVETTGDTDTYLEFYDAQRTLLAEDDDRGESYNARIEIYAESGKTYYVKVKGYNSSEAGPYRIMASFKPLPAARDLRFGNDMSGNISSGEDNWYKVQTTQIGLVTVETSGSVDTFMEAYNSSWALVDSNDDGGEGNNARLEIFADANQTFYIKVRGYGSEDTGSYRILASYEAIQTENNTERSRAVTLKLGEAAYVFLLKSSESRWYVCALPRAALFVVQTRGNMDTLLYIYDGNGTLLVEDDDGGEGYNALISQRLNQGTYYIEVKGYDRSGRCTLHAEIR